MEYVTPEYETTLNNLAETLVTPERFGKVAEAAGQVAVDYLEYTD